MLKKKSEVVVSLKYIELRQLILDKIDNRTYKYGDKLPSENMWCQKLSISRQTVRRAVSQLEQEGVIRRVKGSGTYVDKIVKAIPLGSNIGVLISYLDNYIFPSIMRGVEEVLSREGFGIDLGITHNSVESEAKFLERILNSNLAGLIVEGTRTALPNPNIPLYKNIINKGIPVIFFHNYYPELKCPSVTMDDSGCTKIMTEMLIKAGHKNIAGLFKSDDIQGHWRYKGYIEALREAEIPVCEKYITWYNTENFNCGKITGNELDFVNNLRECTAIVCYNDQVATDIARILMQNGIKIPEDISLVGFDDSYLASTGVVEFTSAAHPKTLMGIEVGNRLIKMIMNTTGSELKLSYLVPPKIIVRNSIRILDSDNTISNEDDENVGAR